MVSSPSALRKLSDSVTDPKYDGTRTTRKQLLESDGELSELNDEGFSSKGEGDIRSSADEENEDLPSQSEASKKEATSNVQHHDADPLEDQTSTLRKTRDEDRKKGKAVSQQIVRRLFHCIPFFHIIISRRQFGTYCSMLVSDFKNLLLQRTDYLM